VAGLVAVVAVAGAPSTASLGTVPGDVSLFSAVVARLTPPPLSPTIASPFDPLLGTISAQMALLSTVVAGTGALLPGGSLLRTVPRDMSRLAAVVAVARLAAAGLGLRTIAGQMTLLAAIEAPTSSAALSVSAKAPLLRCVTPRGHLFGAFDGCGDSV